jgi:hypothetical protein
LPTANKERNQSRKTTSPIPTLIKAQHSANEARAKLKIESREAFQQEVRSTKEGSFQVAITEEQARYLHKHGVDYIYHITSIENLDNILRYGILSHNEAYRLGLIAIDVSMACRS